MELIKEHQWVFSIFGAVVLGVLWVFFRFYLSKKF